MYFGFFLSLVLGILLVVLSVNGRLQNVIAAAFGQQAPNQTPTSGSGGGSAGGGGFNWGGLFGLLNYSGGGGGGGSSQPPTYYDNG